MFPSSSPAFDIDAAIAAAQSRLAAVTAGTGAGTEAPLVSSSVGAAASSGATTSGGVPWTAISSGFSTPLPPGERDSGVLGEFLTGGVPSDSGVFSAFLMTPELSQDLCLGEVAGLKFCTLGKASCHIRKHSKKVAVKANYVYVAGPRNSAFSQLSVDPELIPSDQLSQLLSEKHTLDEWQKLFGSISIARAPISLDEFPSFKARALDTMSFGVTPRKGPTRYEKGSAEADFKLSPIGSFQDDEIDMESLLIAQIDKVYTLVTSTANQLDSFRQDVGNDIDKLESGLQSVSLKTGVDPGLGDSPMLSAWEGISFLHSAIQDLKRTYENVLNIISRQEQGVQDIESRLQRYEQAFQAVASLQTQFNQVSRLVTMLSVENQHLSNTVRNPPVQAAPQFANTMNMGAAAHDVNSLQDQVRRLEARITAAETRSSASQAASPNVMAQVNFLQSKFDILEARVSSKPAYVCGRTFLSLPDMETWVTTHLPMGLFYLFHDVVSLLEHVDPATVHRQDIILEQFQSRRVGYDTDAESRMVTSFKITLPQVFCGDKKESTPGSGGRHFPGCKSYANWNLHDGYTGLKPFILKELTNINRTIKFDISSLLSGHHEARSLANDLHGLSVSFVGEYLNWVDNFYLELLQISGCSSDESWDVTGKCAKQVFEVLREIRNIAGNANMEQDLTRKTARYLYAIVLSHQEMQNFMDKGFRNHESIYPIINFHLFQASASKASLEKFMAEVKSDIKSMNTRCNQIDTLQGKLNKLVTPSEINKGKVKPGGNTPASS
jgi:hypothetical protein